jgi:dynactin complex subunit
LIRTVDELVSAQDAELRDALACSDDFQRAWLAVCNALHDAQIGWLYGPELPMDRAAMTIRELAHKAKAATASSSRFLELEKNNDELRKRLHERQRELDKVRVQLSNMRRMLDEEAKPQGDVMKIKPEHYAHLKAEIQSNLTGRMLTKRRAGSLTIVIDPFT